jgi:AmmeMemoRadiSam system protein B
MFYPESAAALAQEVGQMLAAAPALPALHPKAIIVPHAGYIYSGPVAASIYAPLERLRGTVRRVVLLGPTHRVAVDGLALPASAAFSTPLGIIPIDGPAVEAIRGLPQVVISDAAHALEHSLEVQLPFLQTVLDEFSLLPLAVGRATAAEVAEVLECLWGGDETLIVISSDLSHYLPYDTARNTDAATARHIVALDPHIDHQQACGATPVNGLLLAARRHGLEARLIDLRNSGDTAGDRSRVVGYGAFSFSTAE